MPGSSQKWRQHAATPPGMSRPELEARHGRVWDTRELARDFIVTGVAPQKLLVRRKADGVAGRMCYQSRPRYYYAFEPTTAA